MGKIIHETAIIENGAILGNNITIGAYSIIGKNVTIGDNTQIGSYTKIVGNTTIGKNNEIFSWVSIGFVPQDLKFHGEDTKTIIGDNNKIREFVTIHRGTDASKQTVIGNHNLLMVYSHIAHDCILGDHCVIANAATLAGHVTIEDYVIVGGLTPVHQFTKIGMHSMIGGASGVNQDILPFALAEGNKSKLYGVNVVGLKRRGFSEEEIQDIKNAHKIILRSKLLLEDALNILKEKYPNSKNIKHIINFISKSQRGICR